jgi:hypothetical protein
MPNRLSADRLEAARGFVEASGRPLDRALLRQALGEAGGGEVLAALAPYQNPDGGFGHGLEPDLPSPASSGIAASLGLRFLVRAGASADDPAVARVIGWLGDQLQRERGVWPIIDTGVDLAPHAPWWTFSENLAERWNGFRFNPTAEILAHLYAFRATTPPDLIAAAEAGVRRTLAETAVIEGAYDLKCAARLAEAPGAPAALAAPLSDLVRRSIAAHDPDDEHLAPLELAPSPASRFADALAGRIDPALDELIERQADDGGWPWNPDWNWAFIDEPAATRAERDWRGWATREALETLVAYGRVEGA